MALDYLKFGTVKTFLEVQDLDGLEFAINLICKDIYLRIMEAFQETEHVPTKLTHKYYDHNINCEKSMTQDVNFQIKKELFEE